MYIPRHSNIFVKIFKPHRKIQKTALVNFQKLFFTFGEVHIWATFYRVQRTKDPFKNDPVYFLWVIFNGLFSIECILVDGI